MPTVLNEYEGDGVARSFNIAMEGGYLSRDYVKFYVRPMEALLDWTPLTNNTVTWTGEFSFTLADAIPVGTVLVVFRETPLTPLVDFQNTSRITEKNLDTGVTQPLHKVAELTDLVDRSTFIAGEAIVASTDAVASAEAAAASAVASAESAAGALAVSAEARDVAEEATQTANTALELVEEAVSGAVVSFNGRQGVVTPQAGDYTKSMVGLGSVDNTSDSAKPVSAAQQAALDSKVDKASGKGLSSNDFTNDERVKLANIAEQATKNATDAALRDRSTHTGTQGIGTVTDLSAALAARVVKTSDTGAAILPEGTDAERPAPGATGLYVRLSKTSDKPEWYNRAKSAWQSFGDAGGELFNYAWHNGPRSSIDSGCVPCDGQVLQYADNPVVCQAIWDGKQNAVLDANWAANKNCWSRGDGATWVRVPNLNMADGSAKPFYMRGGPESLTGTWVGDAIRNIVASANYANGTGAGLLVQDATVTGAFKKSATNLGVRPQATTANDGRTLDFDASLVVPTADENRVKTAYGVWTVRVFTEVTNTGAIDAAQLATQLGVVDAALQTLDSQLDFTIIYPNGGTSAAPANITSATRYVMPNPFPGHHVICETQILINGIWGSPGFRTDGATTFKAFAFASQYGDEIVVRTGQNGVSAASSSSGTPHETITVDALANAPARVRVWRLKGVVA